MARPAPPLVHGRAGLGAPPPAEPIAAVVEQLVERYPQYFPGARARPQATAISVTHRRLSSIARVRLVIDGVPRGLYVKIHGKAGASYEHQRGKVLTEFSTLRLLQDGFAAVPGLGVARPVAVFPERLAIVTEEVEGDNLHRLLRRGLRPWSPRALMIHLDAACERAGRWLRHFQIISAAPPRTPHRPEVLVELMRDDLRICCEMGLPHAEAARILALWTAHLGDADMASLPVVGVHPDFQPDNLLVSRGAITVIDFGGFQYGHAASDVARFLASLEFFSRTPLCPRARLHALMRAFLRGYGARSGDSEALLAADLVRCFVRLVAGTRSYVYPLPLRPLARWRTISFLSSWERRLATILALSSQAAGSARGASGLQENE